MKTDSSSDTHPAPRTPLHRPTETPKHRNTAPPPPAPNLLMVDDSPDNLALLAGMLEGRGFRVRPVISGERALQAAQSEPPDLVLLDINMPDMDGYEVCRRLKADATLKAVPVIFISALGGVIDKVKAFSVGGVDYIAKPFHLEEVESRVRTHLTLRAQEVEITQKNTELKEMLHIVCHDLANHFAVMSMSMEALELDPQADFATYLPLTKAALRNGIALTEMIRKMRSAEDKQMILQAVPLAATLAESRLLMQARLAAKQLSLTLEVPSVNVLAEPCLLVNSVFNNLLTNAIKFSHAGSHITIRATEENDWVCVFFRDRGVGMPQDVLAHLFDLGKSHSRAGTAGENGTGFGMPLMRRLVTQFGGRVEVTSREKTSSPDDHGTEFKIWLKAAG
ncbi:MAG: response regulator [Verrucomicrobiota bacterium]